MQTRNSAAEARAEEGSGVRRVDGGRPRVRADLQVRAELRQVHRRRAQGRAADPGVVRPGAVVREGAAAAELPAVGAGAVGPPAGDGHVRGGGGGVLQPEAAEGADADGRRGGGRAGRAGPRFLTGVRPGATVYVCWGCLQEVQNFVKASAWYLTACSVLIVEDNRESLLPLLLVFWAKWSCKYGYPHRSLRGMVVCFKMSVFSKTVLLCFQSHDTQTKSGRKKKKELKNKK